jgi:Zn-dependent protease
MLFSGYPASVIVYLVPAILISITVHEVSHGYVSYRLGDPTAKNAGRLSLNPLKHLDPLGTLMLLLAFFGWAKPVPINPMYYNNRRRGVVLVSIAGPLSNILLALVFSVPLIYLEAKYGGYSFSSFSINAVIYNLSFVLYIININLAVFNIIPVPPLDGSKILSGILPQRQYFKFMQYENYIGWLYAIIARVSYAAWERPDLCLGSNSFFT